MRSNKKLKFQANISFYKICTRVLRYTTAAIGTIQVYDIATIVYLRV